MDILARARMLQLNTRERDLEVLQSAATSIWIFLFHFSTREVVGNLDFNFKGCALYFYTSARSPPSSPNQFVAD